MFTKITPNLLLQRLPNQILTRISPAIFVLLLLYSGCSFQQEATISEEDESTVDSDFQAYTDTLVDDAATFTMVPVEGGTFMMGSDNENAGEHEGPPREVYVDSFWMSEHEVSWDEYLIFLQLAIEDEDPEEHILAGMREEYGIDALSVPTPPYEDVSYGMGHEGYPAISMTHYAAVMYAKWLTAQTGNFYRLPTEAEWEYACRGGNVEEYEAVPLDEYEWHTENSDESYNQVASKQPNPLGLYDMKGNVAEWTMDEYLEDYHEQLEGEPADNPWFKPEVLYPRTVRGSSWRDDPEDLRCTQRRGSDERWKRGDPQFPKSRWWHTHADFLGFRLVRPKETPPQEKIKEYWLEPIEDY